MFLKVLFSLSIFSLAVPVFAINSDYCKHMMTWRNNQNPKARTWEDFSQANLGYLKDLSSSEMKKVHYGFIKLENSESNPIVAEAECRSGFKSAAGRLADRAFRTKIEAEEDEPLPETAENNVDMTSIFRNGERMVKGLVDGAAHESGPSHCSEIQSNSDLDCYLDRFGIGIPLSFEQLMAYEEEKNMSLPSRYSEPDCDCIRDNLSMRGQSVESVINASGKTQDKIKKAIVESAGKKFLNDYASYVEDVQFYTINKAWVLSKNFNLTENILCQDAGEFQKKIDATCAKNGTTPGKETRLASLLGAFGDQFDPTGQNLSHAFKGLIEDINTYTENARNATDKPNILTREDYEPVRFGLSRSQSQVSIVNQLTGFILRDEKLKERLMKHVEAGNTPLSGIMEIVYGKGDVEGSQRILKLLAKKYPRMKDKIEGMLPKIGTEEYQNKVNETFHFAMNLHPGLKNILMEKNLFMESAKVMAKRKNKNRGILTVVEDSKDEITKHFMDKCQTLQQNLAEAVCTKEDDLLKKVNAKDMEDILVRGKLMGNEEKDATDLLICSMNSNEVVAGSAFDKLSLNSINPYASSDYLDRKLHPQKQNNGLANLLNTTNKDPNFARKVSNLTEMFNHERVTMPGSSTSNHNRNSHAMSFLKQNQSSSGQAEFARTSPSASPNLHQKTNVFEQIANTDLGRGEAEQTKALTQVMPNYAVPQMAQPILGPVQNAGVSQQSEAHKKLREFFAADPKKEKLDEYINSIESKDAEDLLDLQKKVLKQKEKISNDLLENERKKTRDMEEKYHEMEKRLSQPSRVKSDNYVPAPESSFSQTTSGFTNHQNAVSLDQKESYGSSTSFGAGGNFRNVASVSNAVNAV